MEFAQMMMVRKRFLFAILALLVLLVAARFLQLTSSNGTIQTLLSFASTRRKSQGTPMNAPAIDLSHIRALASSALSVPGPSLLIEDITSQFPWARQHRIYWAIDEERR